jgi:ABC-2 type transport system permease protein
MSARATLATAVRVVWQIRRDPRTVLLLVIVPCVLLALLKYVLEDQEATFQHIAVPMLGLFPLTSMFLVTSITMLRERSSGTLERLMTLPLSKLDLLAGYAVAFGVLSGIQAIAISTVGFLLLGVEVPHPQWIVILLAVANALLGMALGLFLSAMARTEFQAVQFMPAFLLPQLLLCGLVVARERMAPALEAISNVLPMTYAYDALSRIASPADLGGEVRNDALVTVGFMLVALGLGALTLRRKTQ